MILARISRAIREQNWFAVALEFIIVVAGVLLAFQITAWNAARAEIEREAAYLHRLEAELTAITGELDSMETAINAYFNWIEIFFEGVETADPERAQEGSWGLNAITSVEIVNLEPAALREMISAGELTIIRNETLRAALSSIPQMHSNSQASLEQMASDLTPIAFEISGHFEARLDDVRDISQGGYGNQTIQFDFEAVSQNEQLLRRINYAALQNRFQAAHFVRYRTEIESIRDQVAAEIDARGF
ncbi:hypothetical protein [Hyphobacterium marinum]|uniref:CHASE3 domain-containing protein n=1 Tax=Hyphobacterium marinum TaxID=3116574 RepID=A0ABU7LXX0_9PROT|nr:hypothetical protein [Hyphobacterium sp. Y6023]MEE2566398.1 hypothetical protein [Hyphobacterium sp. Y6023]